MKELLIIIDMQNDFITGSLGTPEAVAIVPNVIEKIKNFKGEVLFTRDTHFSNYLETQEGKNLPIPHCIINTDGWKIQEDIDALRKTEPFNKPTFGSTILGIELAKMNLEEKICIITFIGLCTDICVISNALLTKSFLPEVEIVVDASCCAGVTPESHKNALEAMKMCQIKVINEGER